MSINEIQQEQNDMLDITNELKENHLLEEKGLITKQRKKHRNTKSFLNNALKLYNKRADINDEFLNKQIFSGNLESDLFGSLKI